MKTTHAIAVLLGLAVGSVLFFIISSSPHTFSPPQSKHRISPVPSVRQVRRAAPVVQYAKPARLRIPKIQIDTAIETVGNDERGRMDVPKEATNAGWYEPGFKPGTLGSAVIAAHYDTPLGAPGPFYNLGKLEPGDIVETEDVNGAILKFKVVEKKTHRDADFPIKEVFAQTDQKRLNLITCSGTWNKNAKNYSDRLVVYAVLQ